jgi:hypothetical protein
MPRTITCGVTLAAVFSDARRHRRAQRPDTTSPFGHTDLLPLAAPADSEPLPRRSGASARRGHMLRHVRSERRSPTQSVKRVIAAIGVAALGAGVLAAAGPPAGAGYSAPPPWLPTLQVAKTIAKAQQQGPGVQVDVPPGTVFTIHVDCTRVGKESVDESSGSSPYPVDLTYDSTGMALTATPQDGWQIQDGAWTVSSWKLLHRECTATETAVNGGAIPPSIEVQYKCDTDGTGFVSTSSDATASGGGGTFGCTAPLPPGAYHPSPPFGSATHASVEFTSPWDLGACGADGTTGSDSPSEKCHEVGTLTVDNLDPAWLKTPDDPDHHHDDHDHEHAATAAVPVSAAPSFTG